MCQMCKKGHIYALHATTANVKVCVCVTSCTHVYTIHQLHVCNIQQNMATTMVHTLQPLHTHTHPFNGPFSRTTRVSRYQKGKTSLDFTEARNSEWQWHQLGRMQVCTSLQTDSHASTPPLKFFYRSDALPAT